MATKKIHLRQKKMKKEMNKEYRSAGTVVGQFEEGSLPVISGYAMVFDSQSEYMGMYETIQRGAITEETIKNSDVFACLDHDMKRVLARSNHGEGTLSLSIDDRGLKYEFVPPSTELGKELLEYIKRGDISKSSFGFCVDRDDSESQSFEMRGGVLYRTIKKIHSLFDVSPVWRPAYSDTEVAQRDAEDMKAEAIKMLQEKVNAEMDAKMAEVEELAKVE